MIVTQQIPLQFEHRSALSSKDFLVSDSNREAVEWIDCWPSWLSPTIAINGPSGAGKTHLGVIFIERTQGQIFDAANPVAWIENAAGTWLVDDAHNFIKHAGEKAFLHFYNAVIEAKGNILFLDQRPPSQWPLSLPDLRSRILTALVVEILSPDDALLSAVLVKLLADRQLTVGAQVIDYVVPRMERSFVAAGNLVERLDRLALAEKREITIPLAKRVLSSKI